MHPLRNFFRLLFKIPMVIYKKVNPVGYARAIGVTVGRDCRFLNTDFSSEPYLVTVGDHVTLSYTKIIPHDGGVWVFRGEHPDVELCGPVTIGNNVFVGVGTIILPNVTIGDNCVIGAGAVVTRDIPPNSVAVGVPARVIKTVDEYWQSVQDKITPTKTMSYADKRDYLLERFAGRR